MILIEKLSLFSFLLSFFFFNKLIFLSISISFPIYLSSELEVLITGINPYGGVQPLVLSSPLRFDEPFLLLTGLGELSHFIMNFTSAINSSLKETCKIFCKRVNSIILKLIVNCNIHRYASVWTIIVE